MFFDEYFSARTDFARTGASGFPNTGCTFEDDEDDDDDADVSTMLFTIGRMMIYVRGALVVKKGGAGTSVFEKERV